MRFFPIIALIALLFVSPDLSVGAGLAPDCAGATCGSCDVVAMANNIVKWLIGVLFMIFAIMVAAGGFGLVTSGGNQAAKEAAKSRISNAIIGIVLVLAAWLLVDTLMRALLAGSEGKVNGRFWYTIECTQQAGTHWPGDPSSPDPTGTSTVAVIPEGCTGGSCVALSGVPCTNGCAVAGYLKPKIEAFHAAAGVAGARVTEGMPPTRTHKSKCHSNGTCIDYSKQGGMTAAEVIAVINAAKSNGLRPVYEVHTEAEKQALVNAGAPADSIKPLGNWISAPHFSIYGY